MNELVKEIKDTFKYGTALTRFLYYNLAVFIFFRIIFVVYFLGGIPDQFQVLHWMGVPAFLPSLLIKPWTLFTYMFYHEDFLHIGFNMAAMFWFGKVFLLYFDNRKFTSVYVLGGLSGAVMFILFYNLFPVFYAGLPGSIAIGASASIMALIVAVSLYAPNFKVNVLFFGEVKLIYIGIGSIVMDVILIYSTNAGGHIAHLGGALFGYLWVAQYKKGCDFTMAFSKMLDYFGSLFKPRKLKVTHSRPPVNDFAYNQSKVVNQKEIDRILDKISKGGYESLSKDEKDTLFRLGKN